MATIRINRSDEWMNSARKYGIYIDNEKVGTISRKEIKEFSVQPGKHKVRAKIDWCGSKDFNCELKNEQTETLTIKGSNKSRLLVALCFIPIIFSTFIKNLIASSSKLLISLGIGLSIAIFLVVIYYFTIGRNSYLQIERENKE